jgi:serine/threonine protein kinase
VVSALDVTEIAGRRGIVLEYVRSTLGELIDRRGTAPPPGPDRPPLPDAVALALQQVCAGLAHLSQVTEVAHLDLKPSNVLIDDDGQAKIADFGLAEQVRVHNGRFPVPRGGTWAYAAPEALRQEPCDTRADIFSFGVLLYEACTGRLPYPFELKKRSAAQRKQLLDYYDSPGARQRTKEFYYCVPPSQFPVALSHDNINMLLSNCLGVVQENRNASFTELEPLLAIALRRPPLAVAPAPLADVDRHRRVLALSRALVRLCRFNEAISRLNQLLAVGLPDGVFAEVRDTAVGALVRAGRHGDAAALKAWR